MFKYILYESGSNKFIRFHDTEEPEFHSRDYKATRIKFEGGTTEKALTALLNKHNLMYVVHTLELRPLLDTKEPDVIIPFPQETEE